MYKRILLPGFARVSSSGLVAISLFACSGGTVGETQDGLSDGMDTTQSQQAAELEAATTALSDATKALEKATSELEAARNGTSGAQQADSQQAAAGEPAVGSDSSNASASQETAAADPTGDSTDTTGEQAPTMADSGAMDPATPEPTPETMPTDPMTDPMTEPAVPPEPTADPMMPSVMDPLFADPTCTSDQHWSGGENDRMRPGEACVSCHSRQGEGPRYSIAGTLYPTGHEPDDCNGVTTDSGAVVVITDANGMEFQLSVNSAGNFSSGQNIATPYTAKVVTASGERQMFTPQTNGDCNTCHTADGVMGAPGRIVLPL